MQLFIILKNKDLNRLYFAIIPSVVVVLVHPVILIVISFVISRGKCIVVTVKVPVFVSFVEFAHFPDCHIIIIPSKVALPWFIVVAGEVAIKIAMRVVIVIVSVVGALARSVTVWDVVVVECRVVIGNSRAFGPVRPLVHVGDLKFYQEGKKSVRL